MLKYTTLLFTTVFMGIISASPQKSNLGSVGIDYSGTHEPPESAFVEYLESTGTQYINLPIASSTNMTVEIKVVATRQEQYSRYLWGYGGGGGTKRMGVVCSYFSGKFRFGWGVDGVSGYTPFPPENMTEQTIIISPSNVICKVHGDTVYESEHTGWKYVGNRCSIFTLNASSGYMGWFRIFSLKMYRGNVLVLDLFPIRFPNEEGEQDGAMYDFVSDKILRNSGKGKFLFGKDVAPLDFSD